MSSRHVRRLMASAASNYPLHRLDAGSMVSVVISVYPDPNSPLTRGNAPPPSRRAALGHPPAAQPRIVLLQLYLTHAPIVIAVSYGLVLGRVAPGRQPSSY